MTRPQLVVRLRSLVEREALDAAAEGEGLPVTTWARRVLLRAAGVPADEPERSQAARALREGEADGGRVLARRLDAMTPEERGRVLLDQTPAERHGELLEEGEAVNVEDMVRWLETKE